MTVSLCAAAGRGDGSPAPPHAATGYFGRAGTHLPCVPAAAPKVMAERQAPVAVLVGAPANTHPPAVTGMVPYAAPAVAVAQAAAVLPAGAREAAVPPKSTAGISTAAATNPVTIV